MDPAANLLAWSEDLSNAVWSPAPLLTLTGGVTDPFGGTAAWVAGNAGAGAQSITQVLNAPAAYLYCFSVYLRAAQATAVTVQVGANRGTFPVGPDWTRVMLARNGDASAASIAFAIELPTDASVDLFGPQVEAQGAASRYKTSTTGGLYENARFRDDVFRFTTTDVNRHSATVTILYANHL